MSDRVWPWLLLVLALLPALFISHPKNTVPTPRAYKNVLSVALFGDPGNLDPALASSPSDWSVDSNVFQTLFRVNRAGQVVPNLVSSFKIQGNVLWLRLGRHVLSNGRPLTADVAAGALSRPLWSSVNSPTAKSLLKSVKGYRQVVSGQRAFLSGINVVDRNTFTITLSHAVTAAFLSRLANPALSIVPASDQIRGGVNWQRTNLYGTGGYLMTDWLPGDHLQFVRAQKVPGPKQVDLVEYPSLSDALLSFRTDNVDAVPLTPANIIHLPPSDLKKVRFLTRPGQVSIYYNLNSKAISTYPGFSPANWVRQATRDRLTTTSSWPSGLPAGKPMGLWVNDQNGLAVQLAGTLAKGVNGRVQVHLVSPSVLQKSAQSGSIGAYIGVTNWFSHNVSMPLIPMGSFWLMSSNVRHVAVYPNGSLNWHATVLGP